MNESGKSFTTERTDTNGAHGCGTRRVFRVLRVSSGLSVLWCGGRERTRSNRRNGATEVDRQDNSSSSGLVNFDLLRSFFDSPFLLCIPLSSSSPFPLLRHAPSLASAC